MTNTNMEIFKNEEFGSVRVVVIDNDPWFVGRDVAAALGYANTKDALGKHIDAEDKQIIQRSSGATFNIPPRGLTVINESGLYSLMLSCRLASGKRFKRWITAEVLPTIRKNGLYITDPLLQQFARDPDFAHAVVDALYEQTDRVVQQARYIKDFVDPDGGVSLRVAAKQLNVPEHWFMRFLIKGRFLYRCGRYLLPYAEVKNEGCFAVKDGQTLVTPKGKAMLRDLFMCQ